MCSYCGCESIEVIGRLMADHTDIINAAGQLRASAGAGDMTAVHEHVHTVKSLLIPHTGAEEAGLFRVLRQQPDFTGHVNLLCFEHDLLEALLEDIEGGNLRVAQEFLDALRHHIDKEDNGIFPAAAIALEGADWEQIEALTLTLDQPAAS